MVTTYTDMLDYAEFVAGMIEEQTEMEDFINRCVLFAHPQSVREEFAFTIITENKLTDKIKIFFKKVKEFFTKIFAKFSEKMNALILEDHKYLEKYKDIILGKKCTLESIKMRDHNVGLARIEKVLGMASNFAVPPTEEFWNELAKECAENNADGNGKLKNNSESFGPTLTNKMLETLNIKDELNLTNADELKSACNNYFAGSAEDITVSGEELNMEHIFNAVYQWDKLKNSLNNLKRSYETSMQKIESKFNEEYNKAMNKAKQDAASNPKSSGDGQTSTVVQNANFHYHANGSQSLSEAEITSSSSKEDEKPGKVDIGVAKDARTKASNVANDTIESNKSDKTKAVDTAGTMAGQLHGNVKTNHFDENEFFSIATKYIKAYNTPRNIMFACILNGLNSMERDYMQIIRAHVQSYAGRINNTDDDTNAAGSSISTGRTNDGIPV